MRDVWIRLFVFVFGDRKREPARVVSRLTAFVTAVAGLAGLWGIPLSDAKQTALISTIAVITPGFIFLGEAIRSVVISPATAAAAVAQAKVTPPQSEIVPLIDVAAYPEAVKEQVQKRSGPGAHVAFAPLIVK